MARSARRRLDDVIAAVGGIDLPSPKGGSLLQSGIKTPDGRIDLAPEDFVAELPSALDRSTRTDAEFPLLLISCYRKLRSFNSWTHNMPSLADKLDEPRALLHPETAALDIADGDQIEITTTGGSLQIAAELSDRIRVDVLAVPQFWGHTYASGQTHARARPGVNLNRLHTTDDRDRYTGMPVYNGRPCSAGLSWRCLSGEQRAPNPARAPLEFPTESGSRRLASNNDCMACYYVSS